MVCWHSHPRSSNLEQVTITTEKHGMGYELKVVSKYLFRTAALPVEIGWRDSACKNGMQVLEWIQQHHIWEGKEGSVDSIMAVLVCCQWKLQEQLSKGIEGLSAQTLLYARALWNQGCTTGWLDTYSQYDVDTLTELLVMNFLVWSINLPSQWSVEAVRTGAGLLWDSPLIIVLINCGWCGTWVDNSPAVLSCSLS